MVTAISGAANTPFKIAAQKRALTGSMCKKFSESPLGRGLCSSSTSGLVISVVIGRAKVNRHRHMNSDEECPETVGPLVLGFITDFRFER